MSAAGYRTGSRHSIQELLLIVPRFFPRQFDFYVKCFSVRYSMPPDIRFALMSNVHQSPVLGVKLTDSMVSCHAAILAEGNDDSVLK